MLGFCGKSLPPSTKSPNKSNSMLHLSRQLNSILWKNWLLKKAHPWSTFAEIMLPVVFMALLILIKLVTTKYDSPNIAFYCGNTFPWNYAGDFSETSILTECITKPENCTTDNYYSGGYTYEDLRIYDEYGYTDSASSSGNAFNPLYSFTIADESTIYGPPYNFDNPSLPVATILEKMQQNNALLAISPLSYSEALVLQVQNLTNYILKQTNSKYSRSIIQFASKDDMDDYITDKDYDDEGYEQGKIGLAILLYEVDIEAKQWEYAIRTNFSYFNEVGVDDVVSCLYGQGNGSCDFTYTIPSTQFFTNDLYKPQTSEYLFGYSYSGFLSLQLLMDEYIFSYYSDGVEVMASIGLMPTYDYKTDDFQYVISSTLGIFYMLSFLYPVSRIIRGLVLEKEERIKEGMKMMGLTDFAYNLSWLITLFVQMFIVSSLIVLVTMSSVFQYSDTFLVLIYFMAFSVSVMSLCFLMATLFSRSKVASLVGPMVFFATFFPYYSVADPSYSTSVKTATCLLAPACFALGANVFADYEGGLVGVHFDNASELTSNFSYDICVGMLVFDAVLYGVLAWYLDKVVPSEFGTPLPFYFPFLPSYWCGGRQSDAKTSTLEEPLLHSKDQVLLEPVSSELSQQMSDDRCILIRNLRKVYATTSEDRVAVDCLNMEIFEGQVTVLLGHNGAGKSTTISMLTGLIAASSGDASIRGMKISSDMQAIRSTLGVCPQHDILFPDLTVMQHLQMFATFKGVSSDEVNAAAQKMIAEVGLTEKANIKSSMLSGGQKRKLSVGIALIGDSKIVILDEPTSGMDPYSRRSTWNIIQRNKKNRLILLTTHFMDEADILGDRIAIMGNGQLKCFGSSLFLKKQYGVGYTFTIVRKSQNGTDGKHVRELIESYVPEAEVLSAVGAEQTFRLPFSSSVKFMDLFTALDNAKDNFGIAEYGISVTTLEEVFIRVGKNLESEHERRSIAEYAVTKDKLSDVIAENASIATQPIYGHNQGEGVATQNPLTEDGDGSFDGLRKGVFQGHETGSIETDSSFSVFSKHFSALFLKRYIYGKRDSRMFLCQMVLPAILVILGLSLLLLQPDQNQPGYTLSPNDYNIIKTKSQRNYVPMNALGNVGQEIASRFNGDYSDDGSGVWGVSVPIHTEEDQFSQCSSGAEPLRNMSNFLIASKPSRDEHGSSRYGSVTIAEETTLTNLSYNVLVNGSAIHGAGIYVNLVHEAFLQVLSGDSSAKITVRNYPLPRTWLQNNDAATLDAFTAALFFMIAFCFIPASYVTFVVKEREVKAKHQQIISGVSIYAYWCSTWVWDVVSYLPTVVLIMCIIFAFGVDSYTKNEGAGATVLLFLFFGPAVASFTYMLSFLFKSHSTAQLAIMFFNFLTGLCLMIVSFVLTIIPSTAAYAADLRYVFRLFPSFCLGDGLTQLALCDNGESCAAITRDGYDFDKTVHPLSWDIVGGNLVFLAIETVFYFAIAVLIEYLLTFPSLLAWLQRVDDPGSDLSNDNEDVDVATERTRVSNGSADNDVVCLKSLRKVYPSPIGPKVAVKSLSFGIPKGECFGFLGINGAGKTTTLSILSGEYPPTSGTAFIDTFNIQSDQSKIRRKIGYCPQFDALLELLTVREHLELYARIKGIQGAYLEQVVSHKLDQMDLRDFEHKAAGSLSGGNKRKLSVAIALIGEPSIVFLDEPSTGMDPVARRFMWQVISRISTQDALCSIILTTHSMEEAEALCTRIGIMVNGRLRCLGSGQHLKQRFGNGYEVDIKTKLATIDDLSPLINQLQRSNIINTLENIDLNAHNPLSHSENGCGMDLINSVQLQGPLDSACAALLEPNRVGLIAPNMDGSNIYDLLQAEGSVPLPTFLEWWIAQDYADKIFSFVEREFPGSILLERSTLHSFRFRLLTANVSLATVFGKFEGAKVTLNCIEDYSVGQTTLEQIFNQFAASQDNPEVEQAQLLAESARLNRHNSLTKRTSFGTSKPNRAGEKFKRSNTNTEFK